MQVLRAPLRRQALSVAAPRAWFARPQHDMYGPHKEYFQNPGQTPLPDVTPYPHIEPSSHIRGPKKPSRIVRAARSVFWASLFSTLGIAAGTALITWEYLQPPFEPGSEEDRELFEEILDTLEGHPLVESLREDNWIEENFYTGRAKGTSQGLHLVAERLSGTQGVTVKTFKHPSQEYTMLVFFLGLGIEGWPDVVHGGIITTLLQEGVERHLQNFYGHVGSPQSQVISVDFKKPTRPGDIYAILVPPGAPEALPSTGETLLKLVPILMYLEAAPRVKSSFDFASNTNQHFIEIPTSGGDGLAYAIASVEVKVNHQTETVQIEAKEEEGAKP